VTSEFLALPGAVDAGGLDAGVAGHYGDPFREQRSLSEGSSVVDLSHRAVLVVDGPDRLTWIDSITSQSVRRLLPGQSAETLFLDPAGRLEYAVKLLDDGETLWMLVERQEAEGLLAWLQRMRFMLRVEPQDRSDRFAVVGAMSDLALPVAAPHGVPLVWTDPWSAVTEGGHQYAAGGHPASDWSWRESIVDRTALGAIAAAHPAAGLLAYEALRIAAWRPRAATETDDRSLPHELDWLRSAVHLSKGCYRGQETVAKVHNLGHPPRRLVMLHLDGSESILPQHGDPVLLADAAVGTVTSAGLHFELGPIALATVKRSTPPTATLTVQASDGPVAAGQQLIVPPDAGAVLEVPRLPRLGAVQR
jgi:folate-binding protein YgfZ